VRVGERRLATRTQAIRAGGGFGSIIGRNSFQRREADGRALLAQVIGLLA